MASPEDLLTRAAADGSFDTEDSDAWPRTLKYILDRLDQNFNSFPKPTLPPPQPVLPSNARSPSQLSNLAQAGSSQQSHTSDKENAPPATPPRRPVPVFAGTPPPSQPEAPTFPQEWLTLCNAIRTSLTKNFSKYPPHTLQRLAELVLEPKKHYRFLPSYLRALDRTVSVTSSTIIFPFPQATLPSTAGFLNGTVTPPQSTLGSDESLGGALLTPIPWLANRPAGSPDSTEMADAPSGAGRIETVAVVNGQLISQDSRQQGEEMSSQFGGADSPAERPISQGELLRQEQEAGLTLSNPHQVHPPRRLLEETGSGQQGAGVMESVEGTQQIDEEEEESPHARGPEEIGVEDTGPQRGGTPGKFDYAEAAGRKRRSPRRSPEAVAESGVGSGGDTRDQNMGDEEGKEKEKQDDHMNEDEKVSEEKKMEEDAILQQDVEDQEMQEAGEKPENEVEEKEGKAELEAA